MCNLVTTFQYQNTKNQTVILKFTRYPTYLLICCCFHKNNHYNVLNAATINKFLKTASCSELRKWFDNIILK